MHLRNLGGEVSLLNVSGAWGKAVWKEQERVFQAMSLSSPGHSVFPGLSCSCTCGLERPWVFSVALCSVTALTQVFLIYLHLPSTLICMVRGFHWNGSGIFNGHLIYFCDWCFVIIEGTRAEELWSHRGILVMIQLLDWRKTIWYFWALTLLSVKWGEKQYLTLKAFVKVMHVKTLVKLWALCKCEKI